MTRFRNTREAIQRVRRVRPDRAWATPTVADLRRDLRPSPLAIDTQSVTRLLYERLTEEDVAEVIRAAAARPELAQLPSAEADLDTRRWLVLSYGLWLRLPSVIERTRLPADQPPAEIHAMARGPLAAAGGLYEADMVVNAMRSCGADVTDAGRGLDFGCSSGRVVRVMAAAYPELPWRACDPNEPAIEWAGEHLPEIDFFVNPQQPPLPIAEGELGLVYAISIWSHFAPDLGLRWFDEVHRVIRPGGHLIFTTHGMQSIAYHAEKGRHPEQCREIIDAVYRSGCWYAAEFGQLGDAGVVNPEWGTAFISAEWLLAKLCPRWRVLEFAPGRNQLNQDLYVLQRV